MTVDGVVPARKLRQRLTMESGPIVVPGVPNALTALIVQRLQFEAVYVSGAGVTNTDLGWPDVGILSAQELAARVTNIAEVVSLPLIVDADTGFGDAIATYRTVRLLERAGASAIQLEDQESPKKCGHFADKRLVPAAEMVAKIAAALDARRNDDTVIIARTDAIGVQGFEDAVRRATLYHEVGADVVFVEAPVTREQLLSLPSLVPGHHVANMVEGGLTPQLRADELAQAGFSIVLYANTAMRAAIRAIEKVLTALKRDGTSEGVLAEIARWDDRQELVGKSRLEHMADVYAGRAGASGEGPRQTPSSGKEATSEARP